MEFFNALILFAELDCRMSYLVMLLKVAIQPLPAASAVVNTAVVNTAFLHPEIS